MIQLFIIYLVITECIQILISKLKVIKWILPILNFLFSIFVEINLIVFTMFNENISLLQSIDIENVKLFFIMNIPTIIFVCTIKLINKKNIKL